LQRLAVSALAQRLIKAGAMHLVVPGNLPMGCSSAYLTLHPGRSRSDYDSVGCLKTYNDFAQRHNAMVQQKLEVLRLKYPKARIMYADYYGAAMSFAKNPKQFGESTNQLATAESFLFISIDRREEISGMVSELNGQGGIVLFCVKHRDANHSGMTATLNGNHFRIYGPQRRPIINMEAQCRCCNRGQQDAAKDCRAV
jgi:hypothetical protein